MQIAENIRCNEFTFRSRRSGSQLRGRENQWVCEIWFRGRLVATVANRTAARRWVSERVRAVNAVLEAAREREGRCCE